MWGLALTEVFFFVKKGSKRTFASLAVWVEGRGGLQ